MVRAFPFSSTFPHARRGKAGKARVGPRVRRAAATLASGWLTQRFTRRVTRRRLRCPPPPPPPPPPWLLSWEGCNDGGVEVELGHAVQEVAAEDEVLAGYRVAHERLLGPGRTGPRRRGRRGGRGGRRRRRFFLLRRLVEELSFEVVEKRPWVPPRWSSM